MILTIALGIVLGGILLVLLPVLVIILGGILSPIFTCLMEQLSALPSLLPFLLRLLLLSILSLGAMYFAFYFLFESMFLLPRWILLWVLPDVIAPLLLLLSALLPFLIHEYRKPIEAWMISLYRKLPSSQWKKILTYIFCIILALITGYYLLKSVIVNVLIKPHAVNKKQQEYDPTKDLAPVDSELDIPVRYIEFPKVRYVLSIGRGCGSCHYNHLQAFDELGRELFNTDTSDASFDVAFAESFSIKEPIRIDNEPSCCPSSFQRRYFQFDKKKNAFVERKPWWGFFLEEVGYYEN
jgi:hypothetical protein